MTSPERAGVVGRLRELAGIVAPTTLVAALLFYFGYVATRSRFEYFGVYLDVADLSNQSLLLYGLEVVYVPAALAFLAVLLIVAAHGLVSWLVGEAARDPVSLLVALGLGLTGLLLLGRALVGMFVPSIEEHEAVPGTTALALAAGPALLAYAVWIASRVAQGKPADGPPRLLAWLAGDSAARLRYGALACVLALAVAGLFWAANEFAWAYGAGRAYDDALHMRDRPAVILETKDPLTGPLPGVTETDLAGRKDETYRYRYEGLRLLVAAGGRLFLVPERWVAASRTAVVPYDDGVRMQLAPTR
ncbi:MAG: hypothetical protein ACJ73E_17030 [Mycobacteriales bacterium]